MLAVGRRQKQRLNGRATNHERGWIARAGLDMALGYELEAGASGKTDRSCNKKKKGSQALIWQLAATDLVCSEWRDWIVSWTRAWAAFFALANRRVAWTLRCDEPDLKLFRQ